MAEVITFLAAFFGALTGGVISWVFHALEGNRARRRDSVAAARDVLDDLQSLVPIKRDDADAHWMTNAVARKQLRKSLFVYSAVQTKRHRVALRHEIGEIYRALENFPAGAPIEETQWRSNKGKRLIFSIGRYRDSLIESFAQVPDLRVATLVDCLASHREVFEREVAALRPEQP